MDELLDEALVGMLARKKQVDIGAMALVQTPGGLWIAPKGDIRRAKRREKIACLTGAAVILARAVARDWIFLTVLALAGFVAARWGG